MLVTDIIVLFLLLLTVSGIFDLKGLHLKWGRHQSNCAKLKLIHSVAIVGCYKQCAARASCKSFIYRNSAKACELCANDDTTGGVVERKAGYVLSQKRDWEPSIRATICNCTDANMVCDVEGNNTTVCRTEECEPPISPEANTHLLGNTRDVGSRLIYTCSTVPGGRNVSTVCEQNGTWSPVKLSCTDYLGCFIDRPSPSHSVSDPLATNFIHMTNELCRETCRAEYEAGTDFFHATQFPWACTCGTNYPIYSKVNDSICSKECPGNISQICGGDGYRMSVYKTYQ